MADAASSLTIYRDADDNSWRIVGHEAIQAYWTWASLPAALSFAAQAIADYDVKKDEARRARHAMLRDTLESFRKIKEEAEDFKRTIIIEDDDDRWEEYALESLLAHVQRTIETLEQDADFAQKSALHLDPTYPG